MNKKILLMGLPGSGKTTLAKRLRECFVFTHLNADEIRSRVNKNLGFGIEGRIEQAKRMGALTDIISRNSIVVADFVCPTPETRAEFMKEAGAGVSVIWMDTIRESRFIDTNQMFIPPEAGEKLGLVLHITDWDYSLNAIMGALNV